MSNATIRRYAFVAALAALATVCDQPLGAQTVVGPAGAYSVETTGATKVEYGRGWVRISWVESPAPNPGPTPSPDPDPDPEPPPPPPSPVATGKLWITIVYDSDTETQEQADVRVSLATSPEWAAINARCLAVEDSQDVLDRAKLRKYVGDRPCVIIQEQAPGESTAKVIKTIANPADKATVVNEVKALRGLK